MHLDTACQIAKALHCNVLELHPDEGWKGGTHCAESGLRDIRRTRGYTQSELSEMTGIPQPNISWFETGYRSTSGMRLDTARRLSEALQCDPADPRHPAGDLRGLHTDRFHPPGTVRRYHRPASRALV